MFLYTIVYENMSVPFHAEITPITMDIVMEQCAELIQVYDEACQMLNVKKMLHSLRENASEKQFTYTNVALSIINLLELNDSSENLLPLFETLAKDKLNDVWNTAIELNLMLEHFLESDDY